MTEAKRKQASKTGIGSGRRPIPADSYLLRWSHVVEMVKDGRSNREIKDKHGTCSETVRHIRRFMIEGGWTPPAPVPKEVVRKKAEPRPPRLGMTAEERLKKYPGVVFWLRAGKTMAEVANLEGVSLNTVRVVRRVLMAQA